MPHSRALPRCAEEGSPVQPAITGAVTSTAALVDYQSIAILVMADNSHSDDTLATGGSAGGCLVRGPPGGVGGRVVAGGLAAAPVHGLGLRGGQARYGLRA